MSLLVQESPAQRGCHQADGMDEVPDKVVSQAVGAELRRTREMRGWSRKDLIALLPSGVSERTILSYEQGEPPRV